MSVAEREAIHTLEAILHTELPIAEHTTDTHGATEIVFAIFDLLGLRFIPRLRDAGDLRLHLLGLRFIPRLRDAGDLRLHLLGQPIGLPVDAVLRGRARPDRIVEQYDDLLRMAGSLKRGWVPASLLITRLKNNSPPKPARCRARRVRAHRAHQLPAALLRRPPAPGADRRSAEQGRDPPRSPAATS